MILDGGMGHLLRRNGVEISGPIGTMERFLGVALANRDAPELVRQSHMQFLGAGANVITTNTYACVPAAVSARGNASDGDVIDLIEAGGRIAQQACDIRVSEGMSASRPLVAGCLPPLHETYRADRVAEYPELASTYRTIVDVVSPFCDVLLCETMHSAAEAYAAAEAANETGLPVWVSFTVSEDGSGRLRSGEDVAVGVDALAGFANVQAALLNCSNPEAITSALPHLVRTAPHLRIGVYANGFSDEFRASVGDDADVTSHSEYDEFLTPEAYARLAESWREQGASIIGGCCGIFPEHIEAIASTSVSN